MDKRTIFMLAFVSQTILGAPRILQTMEGGETVEKEAFEKNQEESVEEGDDVLREVRDVPSTPQPPDTPPDTVLAPKRRIAFKKEFPWAVLLSLAAGPELTGGLVTQRWALAAASPGTFRRPRVDTDPPNDKAALGRAYAGFSQANFFQGEGFVDCSGLPKKVQGDTQCRLIVEIVMQNASLDPAKMLIMLRVEPPFNRTGFVATVPIPAQHHLPFFHREQCWSVWWQPDQEPADVLGAEDEAEYPDMEAEGQAFHGSLGRVPMKSRKMPRKRFRRRRRRDEQEEPVGVEGARRGARAAKRSTPATGKAGAQWRWNLWAKPVGLWNIEHCDTTSHKDELMCEDSWEVEGKALQGEPDYTPAPHDDAFGHAAAGPSQCSPRYRRSAAAQCQGMLAGLRSPLEGVYDVLLVAGIYKDEAVRCSPKSNVARRMWLWSGASGSWVERVATNCSEVPRFQALAIPQHESACALPAVLPIVALLAAALAAALAGAVALPRSSRPSPPVHSCS